MKPEDYYQKYLPTLYLQHRAKMKEPVDEAELLAWVREGIHEDTDVWLSQGQVEELIVEHIPAEWRTLTPREADAKWHEVLGIKPKPRT